VSQCVWGEELILINVAGGKLYIMYIEIINKNNNHWLQYERDENDGGAMIPQERGGPRGNYSWILIQPTFLKLLSCCITFYLLLSVPKANY
jgi:hypothetical protein